MKKWILFFIAISALIFSVAGYSTEILSIVPSDTAGITLPTGGVGGVARGYTVTNNASVAVNNFSIKADFNLSSAVATATASAITCTGTLAAHASCTFTVNVGAQTEAGVTTLMPRVCILGGVNCSVPVLENRVMVTTKALQSIAVTPSPASVNGVGSTVQFTATGTYSDSTTGDITTAVTWGSSNTSKATIGASTGLATAVAAGTTSITATSGSVVSPSVTLTVTVGPTLSSIAITPTTTTLRRLATQQYTAIGTYSDNSTQDLTTSVSWSSSNTSVATIGLHTGAMSNVTIGSTNITATSGAVTSNTVSLTFMDFAYVANYGNDTISYCSIKSDGTFNTCSISGSGTFNQPVGIKLNPAKTRLYVANFGNSTISYCPLNTDGSLGTCAATGNGISDPDGIAFTPNGSFAYIVNYDNTGARSCQVNSDGTLTSCVASGSPLLPFADVAVTPDGQYAYLDHDQANPEKIYSCTINSSTGLLTNCNSFNTGADVGTYGLVVHPNYPTTNFLYVARFFSTLQPVSQCTITTSTGVITTCSTQTISGGTAYGLSFLAFHPLDSTKIYLTDTSNDYSNAQKQVILATVNSTTGNLSGYQFITDASFNIPQGIDIV